MKKKKIIGILWYVIPILLLILGVAWLVTRPYPGESVASQGNQHIENINSNHVAYNTTPPTSGPHIGSTARWGIHTEQIPDEIQIHNLEDGGVIVHYDPSVVDEEMIDALKVIVNSYPNDIILEPYADMSSVIVLTAWGRIDRLDQMDESRIREFIDAYRGVDHH